MGLYEDAEKNQDAQLVRQWKKQFDNIISDCNTYIDEILNQRYGQLNKFSAHVNLLKSKFEEMKLKYPTEATQIDGFITEVNSQIATVQQRWDVEIYDKING